MTEVTVEVTTELLQAFADAWNRHDVDALMSFMTPDCVFESSAGPDVCGTRYQGEEAVRAAYVQVWTTFPDARWSNARHFVYGSRGVSEWTFTGKAAGTTWDLLPHQCRRTYARCIVESRMGRASLVFLKWQFKHSSMSMTQLYASNPMQDASIFDEILQEMIDFKVDLIESWLGDQPLSGGAGQQIKRLRTIPIDNRSALLAQTASQVHIRATGHGWCLAQEKGCGGAGLYEATRCFGCKSGVIDKSFTSVWLGIFEQQSELLTIDDAGPAVIQRAEREVKIARQVMVELGALPAAPGG